MPTQEFLHLLTPISSTRRLTVPQASADIEDGLDQPTLPAAARPIDGVTIGGDTALHVVASHGDSAEFVKCARIISMRDQDLLLAVNKKEDTPLHCDARAGNSNMVSCLVRKENVLEETAMHDAVRTRGQRSQYSSSLWVISATASCLVQTII